LKSLKVTLALLVVLIGAILVLQPGIAEEKHRRLYLGEIVRITRYKYSHGYPLEPVLSIPKGYEKNQFTARAVEYFSKSGWRLRVVQCDAEAIEMKCEKDGQEMGHRS
jgi:hypothetical protein